MLIFKNVPLKITTEAFLKVPSTVICGIYQNVSNDYSGNFSKYQPTILRNFTFICFKKSFWTNYLSTIKLTYSNHFTGHQIAATCIN